MEAPEDQTRTRAARIARASRTRVLAICGVFAAALAIAAPAALAADTTSGSSPQDLWSSVFDLARPIQQLDAHRVIVVFDEPSLGQMVGTNPAAAAPSAERVYLRQLRAEQDAHLAALRRIGIDFDVEHRYERVLDGVSLIVHSDDLAAVAAEPGVESVEQVTTVYPAADAATPATNTAVVREAAAASAADPVVAVLDTGIDFDHPYLTAEQAGPAWNAIDGAVDPGASGRADSHGTEVAGGVVTAASGHVRLDGIRVLQSVPVLDGTEAVLGRSDDLLAGFEHAVDPNADGVTSDHASVILAALEAPAGGFAGSAEEQAVAGAEALGAVTVAAAGNDGAGSGEVGTIGAPGAAQDAIAVGAIDLRSSIDAVNVRVAGGSVNDTLASEPLLSHAEQMPQGALTLVAVGGSANSALDYYDANLQSEVSGKVVLVQRAAGVLLADQIRAAADAGAAAVLVGGADADALAGVVDAPGADIPAVGIAASDALDLAQDADNGTISVAFGAVAARSSRVDGAVADFSSRGPRYDGLAKPDLVAPGVDIDTSDVGTDASGAPSMARVTGTSIAAALAAGQVAVLRGAHPAWSAQVVRAALEDHGQLLAADSGTPIEAQGGGVIDAQAAAAAQIIATPARLDFGILTAGQQTKQSLAFTDPATGLPQLLPRLQVVADTANDPVSMSISTSSASVSVPADAAPGIYGGWIEDDAHSIAVPWSVVVRTPSDLVLPWTVTLSKHVLAGNADDAADLALTLAPEVGTGGSLQAAQRVQVELFDAHGDSLGSIADIAHVLPGTIHIALTAADAQGHPLAAGSYRIAIRAESAAEPVAGWQTGPSVTFKVR